jgi:uncharacterized protein with PIN domain
MTRYYCDICHSEIYVSNQTKVLIAPSIVQDYDLCPDCKKAIEKAKADAEIKTVSELRRKDI